MANFSRQSTNQNGVNYLGNAQSSYHNSNQANCQQMCIAQPSCAAWTYNTQTTECQLKNNVSGTEQNSAMVSGLISTNPYYVSGTPASNDINFSMVSTDMSIPFNGTNNAQTWDNASYAGTVNQNYPVQTNQPVIPANNNQSYIPSSYNDDITVVGMIYRPNPTPSNGVKVASSIHDAVFPWTQNSSRVYAKTPDQCKNACASQQTCSGWSYTPNSYGPSCLINKSAPETLYRQPGAQGEKIYNLVPMPRY